jgi:rare lipoprotein A (peptidoglycan hydrolase)
MTRRLAQREVGLAGVALLAAAVSLAITSQTQKGDSGLPKPTGSYTALAGSTGSAAFGKRTACGQLLKPSTQGVAHPVLPCGVRVYVSYRGKHVLTQVIDRGPYVPGRQFDLTSALAHLLGLVGVQRIQWSYASTG